MKFLRRNIIVAGLLFRLVQDVCNKLSASSLITHLQLLVNDSVRLFQLGRRKIYPTIHLYLFALEPFLKHLDSRVKSICVFDEVLKTLNVGLEVLTVKLIKVSAD